MLGALFVRFWQGFLLWKPFREDRSRWQGDPVCVIFGHSHWKSQIVVLFLPFPHSCMFFFLPSFPLSFLRTFSFCKAYIVNNTTSPKSRVYFWWIKLWIFFFCLPRFGKSCKGHCLLLEWYEWCLEGELGREWQSHCHFTGFSSMAAHFFSVSAAVLSPGTSLDWDSLIKQA